MVFPVDGFGLKPILPHTLSSIMKTLNAFHREVEDRLQTARLSDRETKFKDLRKYLGTNYEVIGLSVPRQRDVFKKGYSFSSLPVEKQFEIWSGLWNTSPVFEVMSQALFFISRNIGKMDAASMWKRIRPWVTRIDNWAHSDSLSGFYAFLLEQSPGMVYPTLKEWNRSDNPWERRQSLVSLIEMHNKRNQVLPSSKIFPMIKNLLRDEDYFVQKGLGWTLREAGWFYPDETWNFLRTYCGDIHPAAFSAAAEKLTSARKNELKEMRKACRASK